MAIPTWPELAWKALTNPPRSRTQLLQRAFHQIESRSSYSTKVSPLLHICFVIASPRNFLTPLSLNLHMEISRLRRGQAVKSSTFHKFARLCQMWSQTASLEKVVILRRGFTLLGLFTPPKPIGERILTELEISKTDWVPSPKTPKNESVSVTPVNHGECITLIGPVDFRPWQSFGPIKPYAAILNISIIGHVLSTNVRLPSPCFLFVNIETLHFLSELTIDERRRIFPKGSVIVAKSASRDSLESSFAHMVPDGCDLVLCRSPQHLFKVGSPNMAQNAVWHLLHTHAKVNMVGFNLFTSRSKYGSLLTGRSIDQDKVAQRCGFSQHDPLVNWFFLKRLRALGLIEPSDQIAKVLAMSPGEYLELVQTTHGVQFD